MKLFSKRPITKIKQPQIKVINLFSFIRNTCNNTLYITYNVYIVCQIKIERNLLCELNTKPYVRFGKEVYYTVMDKIKNLKMMFSVCYGNVKKLLYTGHNSQFLVEKAQSLMHSGLSLSLNQLSTCQFNNTKVIFILRP
jgi:hypothetical protein